uniref:Caveolin n=1 Tax=Salvator merianae TaxID=96440 RepID=A0A8D0BB04_SALMN
SHLVNEKAELLVCLLSNTLASAESSLIYLIISKISPLENLSGPISSSFFQLEFSDILAEPSSFRSFDRVWTWSDIVFESSRLWCYRIISLLCAVPVSLFSGFLFACLGCLHIWCVMPCIQLCTMAMPPIRTLWASCLDVVVAPLFTSLGRCCSAIYLTVTQK